MFDVTNIGFLFMQNSLIKYDVFQIEYKIQFSSILKLLNGMHMNYKKLSTVDMRAKNKIKVCSTPERRTESPTLDNDSICDSETASPIHFLCTQEDADVFYNFYTPKSESEKSKFKTTPVSRKPKKPVRLQTDKQLPKRKIIKPSQQRNKLLQELRELNQNVHELVKKSPSDSNENQHSEEDVFSDTSDISPRGGMMFRKRCLRKNVLSSKFIKPEPECGLESDDSLNECLIQVSQAVEEKLKNENKLAKRQCFGTSNRKSFKTGIDNDIDQDSMDDILSNVKLESPRVTKLKHFDSSQYPNDSFDSLLGNINDSTLDRLSQISPKNAKKTRDITKVKADEPNNDSIFLTSFVRHNSMPESPSTNKPSTSGMTFGRYKSMPFNQSSEDFHDSQIRYTSDEINKKRQQAREKLLAKGMLRSTQQRLPTQTQSINNNNFPSHVDNTQNTTKTNILTTQTSATDSDMKLIIEKKRQEALMKLRKRQAQCR